MPSSTTQALTQPEALRLHQRLLEEDPTAPNDLAEIYLEPLIAWLPKTAPRVPLEVRIEAAEDALLALIRNPRSYSPERQSLEAYLRMSARGDLLNLLEKERRYKSGQVSWKSVELSADAGKYLGQRNDPSLAMQLAEEERSVRNSIPEAIRKKLSATDLRGMELILRKERRCEVFAELYGLLHLPAKEQAQQVKRIKDRLKKMMKREGIKV